MLLDLAINQGKYIFAQLFETVYWYEFDLCVNRYQHSFPTRRSSDLNSLLVQIVKYLKSLLSITSLRFHLFIKNLPDNSETY